MTEAEAAQWLADTLHVPRETRDRLERFTEFLKGEALQQNLVSRSTIEAVWARHIVDSAQLLTLAPAHQQRWLDLGSGAGFPGLIIAALSDHAVTLVEERRKRIDFLNAAAAILGVSGSTTIIHSRAETLSAPPFDIISARAFAPLPRLLSIADRVSGPSTLWLLPKGRGAQGELDAAAAMWQGDFQLEPSVTDPDSAIVVARNVRPREQR